MIDTKTGEICFDSGFCLNPLTTIKDLSHYVDVAKDKIVDNGLWKSYVIRNISLAGHLVSLSVSFEDDRIKALHISCSSGLESWADYSHDNQSIAKTTNDKLLEELFDCNSPYQFSWGIAESSFDTKTGDACIVITYDKSQGELGSRLD